mmetsp:Transcript_12382/g.53155  ORF Transcript_12382/g.53155 Transcript_12382/m.53155 type:complete len:255 (+) Transcript_12382:2128-2892(+)
MRASVSDDFEPPPTVFLAFHSPTPAPRLSKTRAPPHTHLTRDAPGAFKACALAPGEKYVKVAGVGLSSRAKRHESAMSVPHVLFKQASTSSRADTYACVLRVGLVIRVSFFDDGASLSSSRASVSVFSVSVFSRRPPGPGMGFTFRSSVAKNPPMSWSCGTSRMHRSRGGPLIRTPSLVTPAALGGNTDGLNARRNPSDIAAPFFLRVLETVPLRDHAFVLRGEHLPGRHARSAFQVANAVGRVHDLHRAAALV